MWTETTRVKYERKSGRYASDTTDLEWQWIEPLMVVKEGRGRPRKWPMREIVNAMFYILRSRMSKRLFHVKRRWFFIGLGLRFDAIDRT